MALPLLMGIPNMALGAFQAYQGFKGLKQLSREAKPEYSVSPELQGAYSRASTMSNRGFTAEEENAFRQNLGSQNRAAYNQTMQTAGGQLGQSVLAGITSRSIGGLNQFAGQNAALRRQNIQYADQLAGQIQTQRNVMTEAAIQDRIRREQALGGAAQTGLSNLFGGLNLGLAMRAGGQNRALPGGGLNNTNGGGDFQPSSGFVSNRNGFTGDVNSPEFEQWVDQDIANF